MPELPEVEAMARLLSRELSEVSISSVAVRGVGTLRSFDPPIDSIAGLKIEGVGRRGKLFLVSLGDLTLIVHLMAAGRLQLFDKEGYAIEHLAL